jgi:hypothetical protein
MLSGQLLYSTIHVCLIYLTRTYKLNFCKTRWRIPAYVYHVGDYANITLGSVTQFVTQCHVQHYMADWLYHYRRHFTLTPYLEDI